MVKGVAVNLKSYAETIPKLLKLIKFDDELKKHEKIVLKPNLINGAQDETTKIEFFEPILKFCMENKNPGAEVTIAEGCDGRDTMEVFEELGYTALSGKYGIGLLDLNNTETEEIESPEFLEFTKIIYPKVLLDSFIISTPILKVNDEDLDISASLENMLGAFPAKHYKRFFSKKKNKLDRYKKEYQIHDITKCKMPNFAIIDASNKELLFAGQPLEMDKQAAKSLGLDWQVIEHLRLVDESQSQEKLSEDAEEILEDS